MEDGAVDGLIVRERRPQDDAQVVDLGNRLNPLYPPSTVEEVRARIAATPADLYVRRWVGEVDGQVVASASLAQMRTAEPGAYWISLAVEPERQRHGIGSTMLQTIVASAQEAGASRLYAHVPDDRPGSFAFANQAGFAKTGKSERLSRLNVHSANLDGFQGAEERLRAEGVRVVILAEMGMENQPFLRALWRLDGDTQRDVPGSEVWEPDPFDEWVKMFDLPGISPEWFWVAVEGERPVGTAVLQRQGENAAWNAYTSADRAYRGKGIARALKLRTIEWARTHGVDYIYTGNNAENHRMLAINISLGYEMLPAEVEVVRTLRPQT